VYRILKPAIAALSVVSAVPVLAQPQVCLETRSETGGILHRGGQPVPVRFAVRYFTQIGTQDTVNSGGARLTGYRTTLQQDRTNVNKFGKRDYAIVAEMDSAGALQEYRIYDDPDDFFTTPARRALFQDMPLIAGCDENGRIDAWQQGQRMRDLLSQIATARIPVLLSLVVTIIALPDGGFGMYLDTIG